MTLIRYQPWSRLNQLHRELDRMFEGAPTNGDDEHIATSDWQPAVDIKEDEKAFTIHADVPGVDPKDIEVHMENGVLTIKGERESEKRDEREGYKRIERAYGSFYRRFSLPDSTDADNINAKSSNGVLEVTIPKMQKTEARKISVES